MDLFYVFYMTMLLPVSGKLLNKANYSFIKLLVYQSLRLPFLI